MSWDQMVFALRPAIAIVSGTWLYPTEERSMPRVSPPRRSHRFRAPER
jgi:hypothetical protein